jgi:hypothetical protein
MVASCSHPNNFTAPDAHRLLSGPCCVYGVGEAGNWRWLKKRGRSLKKMTKRAQTMTISSENDGVMEIRSQQDITSKWEFYTPQQQAHILVEFRKKFPNDSYCKTTLYEFLSKKLSTEENKNNK